MTEDAVTRLHKPLWKRVQRMARKRKVSGAAMLRIIVVEWFAAEKEKSQ